ncbi:MAG TPA: ATP-binding protein, partial [Geomonas sp.]
LSEVVDIITPELQRKGLDFAIQIADEMPYALFGDQMRLRQVLINLIGNAVKFTDAGKVVLRLGAGRAASNGERELTISVIDTGIGIPDDKKGLLFQAFSQVAPSHSRSFDGPGLGLAICRKIMELMGGAITFVSEEGVGSTFSFTIPLAEAGLASDALSAAEPQATETVSPAPEGERVRRILLAEDDATTSEVLGLMLKRSNYQVDFAENGLQAIGMWEKGGYDLVLMDVQMPHFNGFEATRAIREKELERGGHVPIVAMTAHALKEDEERCIAAGMDGYISKPIDLKKTLHAIGKRLEVKSCNVC